MKKFQKTRKAHRSGFTLIELVMVVMILAIVAGLAVPVVGWVRRSANYAAQANTQQALVSNLEFYRTTYGNNGYPDHMDSLLMSTGAGSTPTAVISYAEKGLYKAGSGSGSSEVAAGGLVTMSTISDGQAQCFNWLSHVMDHDTDANAGVQGNPSNTGMYERDFDHDQKPSAPQEVAVINRTSDEGVKLIAELYPDGIPTGIELVALGLGRSNDLVGRTLQAAPMDPRVDASSDYARYVAVYACYTPRAGRRAQLKCVVNAKGRLANDALSEFWQSTNPE